MAKTKHVGTRISPVMEARLDLVKDLRGFPSISALVEDYIKTGLALDSTNIEQKIEERLAAEKNRLLNLARGVQTEVDDDEGDDDGTVPSADDASGEDDEPDMFGTDPEDDSLPAPAAVTPPQVG